MSLGLYLQANTDFFFTEKYKVLIRSNKEFLIRSSIELPIIDRLSLHVFRHDVYKFLRTFNVEEHMLWTNAFINDIINPNQDISKLLSLRIVDEGIVAPLVVRSNTKTV